MHKIAKTLISLSLLPQLLLPNYIANFLMEKTSSTSNFCPKKTCLAVLQGNTLLPIISHEKPIEYRPVSYLYTTATAYSSTKDQTDSTPFISASGRRVYDGMVAANFLKFGTKIKMPQIFGNKIFTVHDRMNKKYSNRIDIWFPTREQALDFGKKKIKIVIVRPK